MTEGGILSAIAIIFAFLGTYLPLVGPLINFIWPVPIILLGVRHGYKWSVLAAIASGLLIGVLIGPVLALTLASFALIGIVVGQGIRLNSSAVKTVLWGAAAAVLSIVAVIAVGMVATGTDLAKMQADMLQMQNAGASAIIATYKQAGMSADKLAQLQEMTKSINDMTRMILPAGLVSLAVAITYLNFIVSRKILRRLGNQVNDFPPLKYWNFPYEVAYLFGFALVGIYWGQTRNISFLYVGGLNVQAVTSWLLMIQGLALIFYFADKYKLSRLSRGIILVLALSNVLFWQVLIYVGVLDIAFDYRRLRAPDPME
jgi:uncharacterized protein YybS (DUF2232 family)